MSRFRTSGRSVFDLILSEHSDVRSIYSQIQQLVQRESQSQSSSSTSNSNLISNSATITQLCFILIRDICVHSHKEAIAVYPLLEKIQLPSSSKPQPSHACEEHVMVERQLLLLSNELESCMKYGQPISSKALDELNAMMKDLFHHIEEEETILLPALRSSMSEEESIRLGREWEGLNGRVASRPHPDAPALGALAAESNAAQAPLDALQDEGRFKHMIPTAAGSTTADALTPYEQEKLNLSQPTPSPNISMAPFHAGAPNPSDLTNANQLPGKENDGQQQQMSAAERDKQTEMEMS